MEIEVKIEDPTSLADRIAERRKDRAFMERIRQAVRDNKPVLDLLAGKLDPRKSQRHP